MLWVNDLCSESLIESSVILDSDELVVDAVWFGTGKVWWFMFSSFDDSSSRAATCENFLRRRLFLIDFCFLNFGGVKSEFFFLRSTSVGNSAIVPEKFLRLFKGQSLKSKFLDSFSWGLLEL